MNEPGKSPAEIALEVARRIAGIWSMWGQPLDPQDVEILE